MFVIYGRRPHDAQPIIPADGLRPPLNSNVRPLATRHVHMSQTQQATGGRIAYAGAIHFSAATITESGPPLDHSGAIITGTSGPHEDDWRQIELVPIENLDRLNSMFEEQHHLRNQYAVAGGFEAIYLRTEYPVPLSSRHIQRHEIINISSEPDQPNPLYMGPAAGLYPVTRGETRNVANLASFYFTTTPHGKVDHCGLFPLRTGQWPEEASLRALHALGTSKELLLVDWFRLCGFYLADIDSLLSWLGLAHEAKEA